MPTVPQILKMRQQRNRAAQRRPAGRLGLVLSTMLSLFTAFVVLFLSLVYADLTANLPSLALLPALLSPPDGLLLQPTRVYDRSGEHLLLTLQDPAADGRQYLRLRAQPSADGATAQHLIPEHLVLATVAASDPRFWSHTGYTWPGIAEPTLAQRLVSELLLWDESPGLRREFRERLLAAQITNRYGRDQVLEWYLNNANYGHLAFGADAAARLYFGEAAQELTLAEAALLAAVSEAPALNPIDAPRAALERQEKLLQVMAAQGLITPEQARQARQEKLAFASPAEPASNPAPVFTELVLAQLARQIPRERIERGGLRVITTLDYDLQLQAACTSTTQLARLESPIVEVGPACEAARLLPTLPHSQMPSSEPLQAEVIILDSSAGEILALVSENHLELEPGQMPAHPAGSLLTPFIYLSAFTQGYSPASLVWDIPFGQEASPAEALTGQFHGPVRLRTAFANDYILPAARILSQVGVENVRRTAQQLGLSLLPESIPPESTGFLTGDVEVNLLEASQAFGVFANQGVMSGSSLAGAGNQAGSLSPLAVERVEDPSGQIWLDGQLKQERPVITSQLAYLVTHVLSDEAARWPSLGHPNALEVGRPAAVKLGQTMNGMGAWTIGYSPQRVVGVWLGRPGALLETNTSTTEPGETSAIPGAAAALWHAVFKHTHDSLPVEKWPVPNGINQMTVCDPSGMLPTADCPGTVEEVFLTGTEPVQPDNLYRRVQVDRETGYLATIFTPSELIEERVFMNVPPEAAEWARQAGIPEPPALYDVVTAIKPSPDVNITSPAMFSYIRGEVPIHGTARADELSFFRVQVGAGLNPKTWLQIGEDMERPTSDSQLALWDTSGLNGVYTVQLLLVREDQHIETAAVQVTVDNTPPEVNIVYPEDGQEIQPTGRSITLQAQPTDELVLQEVAFYVDDRLAGVLTQAPFILSWQARPGEHTLRVVATDAAGNTGESSATFAVEQ